VTRKVWTIEVCFYSPDDEIPKVIRDAVAELVFENYPGVQGVVGLTYEIEDRQPEE
jgi:hypothetical protein